ncbi:hypothetical protein BHE74_00049888 [Ensete ventricosum]|nr:hypothetical protein BHE74_00049888 [Ensete ventricosum]
MKLQPDDGPRSSLGIKQDLDDAMGPRWEFARRFTEGIGKLARNTPEDHQKKIERFIASMPEAIGLAGVSLGLDCWSLRIIIIKS